MNSLTRENGGEKRHNNKIQIHTPAELLSTIHSTDVSAQLALKRQIYTSTK